MSAINDAANQAYKNGREYEKTDKGFDPGLKGLKAITKSELREELLTAKRESVGKYNGKTDDEALKRKLYEIVKKYSRQSGILRERGVKHLSPTEIVLTARNALGYGRKVTARDSDFE